MDDLEKNQQNESFPFGKGGVFETEYQKEMSPDLPDSEKPQIGFVEYMNMTPSEMTTTFKQVDEFYRLTIGNGLKEEKEKKDSYVFKDETYSTYSQYLAQQVAKFYCNQYPDRKEFYEYREDKSLTDYVNRIKTALDEEYEKNSFVPIPIKNVLKPVDKLNGIETASIKGSIWATIENLEDGQLALNMGTTNNPAVAIYSIQFDNLPDNIQNKLTPFDKRVAEVTNSLILEGNKCLSLSYICKAMGMNDNPTKTQRKRVADSLEKLNNAKVKIDCTDEREKHKKSKIQDIYEGRIFEFETGSRYINGVFTDRVYHFFRDSCLLRYSIDKNQIIPVSTRVMNFPLSLTDMNILLEDYFVEFVKHNKNKKNKNNICTMKYETIYKKCKITTKSQRQRAKKAIEDILEHLKANKEIKSYKLGDSALGEPIKIDF